MKARCPDEEILASYMEGGLSPEDRLEMDTHLSDCEMCLENFVIGRRFILESKAEHAPAEVTQAAVRRVADMNRSPYEILGKKAGAFAKGIFSKISDYLDPGFLNDPLVPATRDGRSASEEALPVEKRFKGIVTEFHKTGEDRGKILVRLANDTVEAGRDIRVTLKRGNREVASAFLDKGYALFDELPFHPYHLLFAKEGMEIESHSFDLGEILHGRK